MAMSQPKDLKSAGSKRQTARTGFILGASLVLVAAAVLAWMLKSSPKTRVPISVASTKLPAPESAIPSIPLPKALPATAPVVKAAPAPAVTPTPLAPELLSVNQLMDELSKIGKEPVSAEQAARFKADLKELIKRGAASVPAIQNLLSQNVDVAYGDVQGGDQLGYSSLRATMIDALSQIGGPEAQAAMLATMNSTAAPSEILQLAQDIDKQSPGEYRDQIVSNIQATLQMASSGQLGTNTELGPAFRALQNYGGANTTADIANNDPLDFYKAVQLANIPNGGGLSSLIQMEQNSSGASQVIATEMIAQLADQNDDALNTLATMAQNGQIEQDVWVKLAPILAGQQYQLNSSGDNYTLGGGATTPDQISQRLMLIDAFTSFVPPGSAAATALQHERTILSGKLGSN